MKTAVVTGSAGLIGAEAVHFFAAKGFRIVGIDNDMRARFFGAEASTDWCRKELEQTVENYTHESADIRDAAAIDRIFAAYNTDIDLIIHAAAQPSHDWAAREPETDFTVNAIGTLVLLEATRRHCPVAKFIFLSTNKVYGDNPNRLPLVERETRWELDEKHAWFEHGIPETLSIDQCKHSLFGASKASADLMVQEYGRYFGMNTVAFRGGCLTGGRHSGTELHGFLSYLMRCCLTGTPYTVYGYEGKQVRDNIHAYDLVNKFWHYYKNPRPGEVYNTGGSRHSHCSLREAVALCEEISGKRMTTEYKEANRIGDHIWYVSDVRKFKAHYPEWNYRYGLRDILTQVNDQWQKRLSSNPQPV